MSYLTLYTHSTSKQNIVFKNKIIRYILTKQKQHNKKLVNKGELFMKKLIYSALILYAILFKISLTFQKPIPLAHNLNEIKKTISYIGFVKLPPAFKNAPLEQCPAPRIYYGGMVLPVSKTYDNDDCPLFSYTCPHITHATQIDIVIALIGSPTSITISSLEVPKILTPISSDPIIAPPVTIAKGNYLPINILLGY